MFEFETLSAIGQSDCKYEGAITFPIFQTSTFSGMEYSYTRCSNPTREEFEKTLALLEGGGFAFSFSSGLAAVNSVFSLLKSGDRVIVSDDLYGGTYRMITKIYEKYGIAFDFVDMTDENKISHALKSGAAMVFAETPTNPMMKIAPIEKIASLCRESGALFVVDNTFLTPYFQNPLLLGADIVLHSATKFISGHHDCVAGVVVTDNEPIAEKLKLISMTLGNALSPFDAWLALRGLRTLPLRMEKHQENAFEIAEFLKTLPEVDRVIYPGLKEHEGHSLCKSQSSGFGGVVSFSVRSDALVERMRRGGRIIKFAESLGGFRTLITYPLTQTHASIPEEIRNKIGITDKLFRLSLGLENSEDIKKDLASMFYD